MIGRYSRGDRPFIFSTELARSGNDHIKHPDKVRAELKKVMAAQYAIIKDSLSAPGQIDKANKVIDKHLEVIQRSVANYGMIGVRTDGNKVIIFQRLEHKRSKSIRWNINKFEADNRGQLRYK